MEQHFPSVYPLNGSDYFQVFLHRHHMRYGTMGNVSRLVVYLEHQPDIPALEQKLRSNPYVSWMHSLRLQTSSFFRLPHWKVVADSIQISSHEQVVGTIDSCRTLFNRNIDPSKGPSLEFDVLQINNQWAFVLSWNHILMDARGAELLLTHIELENEIAFFAKDNFPELPWKNRLKEISAVKEFLVPRVKHGLQLLNTKKKKENNNYRVITFSEIETKQMDEIAVAHRAGVSKSSFYLAAIQNAFQQIAENATAPSWVPVPQDQRKKGQQGPVMANQVSFLFYSLPGEKLDVGQSIGDLRNQMIEQMRSRMTKSYHIMMDSMRRFPAWLYRHLVASPTNGALASYFFSDTGNSLTDLRSLDGGRIAGATHYPPNSAYPGLTIIFMRFNNCQQIICAHPDTTEINLKMDTFERELKNNLLNH